MFSWLPWLVWKVMQPFTNTIRCEFHLEIQERKKIFFPWGRSKPVAVCPERCRAASWAHCKPTARGNLLQLILLLEQGSLAASLVKFNCTRIMFENSYGDNVWQNLWSDLLAVDSQMSIAPCAGCARFRCQETPWRSPTFSGLLLTTTTESKPERCKCFAVGNSFSRSLRVIEWLI